MYIYILLLLLLSLWSLAHPACLRKALRTLFVHTERTVVFTFRTSKVMRSVRSSHLFLSSEISRPSSARVSGQKQRVALVRAPFCFISLGLIFYRHRYYTYLYYPEFPDQTDQDGSTRKKKKTGNKPRRPNAATGDRQSNK